MDSGHTTNTWLGVLVTDLEALTDPLVTLQSVDFQKHILKHALTKK